MRRAALGVALLAPLLAALLVAVPVGGAAAPADAATKQITLPIHPDHVDRVRWTDTWGAARSGGRRHIGVDMLGPKMVPLVAAADSEVTWGRFDNDRGTIVRLRDAEGWEYQYIHLNNDSPGTDDGNASCNQALAEKLCATLDGTRLQRGVSFAAGEFIGFLGDSGNAESTAAHLHFEIYQPDGSGGVVPVNPTPFVDSALIGGSVDTGPVGPFINITDAADEIYRRLEGRTANLAERQGLASAVDHGGLAEALAAVVESNPSAAMIDRLYLAFFQRPPDDAGWNHWIDARADGDRLEDIAEWFAESEEFRNRYGSVEFSEFLDRLYLDVLGRPPDEAGKNYWLGLLNQGRVSRGTIVVYFTEGAELRRVAQTRSELTVIRRALGQSRPTDAEVEAWRVKRSNTDLATAANELVAAVSS